MVQHALQKYAFVYQNWQLVFLNHHHQQHVKAINPQAHVETVNLYLNKVALNKYATKIKEEKDVILENVLRVSTAQKLGAVRKI